MAASSHALDVEKYTLEAARLLIRMREQLKHAEPCANKPCSAPKRAPAAVCLLVLGGLSASELAELHDRLISAIAQVGGDRGKLRLYSKETLLPRTKWSAWFGGYDDLVGMVDLEVAHRANAFIGSPFSSFSVVAAALRRVPCTAASNCSYALPPGAPPVHFGYTETEMVPVDVSDQLGRVYSLHFPYTDEEPEDRCESLAVLHDWKKPGGDWSCPAAATRLHKQRSSALDPYQLFPRPRHPQCDELGTSLRADPPVDAPSRLGYNCTHSVVTALYGGDDKLTNYSHFFQASVERQEREQGIRTCWFAFTDTESVPELSAYQATLAEAASNSGKPWIKVGLWNLVILPEGSLLATLPASDRNKIRSRLPKMMAHCVLRYSHQMLYLDAKVSLRKPTSLWQMLNQLSDGTSSRSGSAWVSPLHSTRSSVRDEMVCLYQAGILTSKLAFEQLRAYHAAGFPSNVAASKGGPGLSEGEWHARDLRSADSTSIGNAWFNEFWRWSKHNLRDQISFNYVIWKLGLLPSQQPKSSATIRGSDMAAQIQDNADSRGFAHFQAGGGNQSLSPARSGRKSRLLLVHNGHTIEHKRDVSTEEKFMADKFARFNLDWKALRNLKAGHQWCEYLSFGLDNGKLLSKVKSLLEG